MNKLELEPGFDTGKLINTSYGESYLVLSQQQKEKIMSDIILPNNDLFNIKNVDKILDDEWRLCQDGIDSSYRVIVYDDTDEIVCFLNILGNETDVLNFLGITKDNLPHTSPLVFDDDILDELETELNEDTNLDLEVSTEPQDIYALYDEIGVDIFSDSNIETLKRQGNINPETGMIITFNPEEDSEPRELSFDDLYDIDYNFIDCQYIKYLIISTFNRKYPNGLSVNISSDDIKSYNSAMSSEFLSACMNEDVFEYFSNNEIWSFDDVSHNIDDIDNECLDLLESMGFPRDIYTQLDKGTADEEHPLAEYYPDLESAFEIAVSDAQTYGAEADCLDDFNRALKNLDVSGCEFIGRDEQSDYHEAKYLVKEDFVSDTDNIYNIWEDLRYESDDIAQCVQKEFIEEFNNKFSFYEPYSGWYNLDVDTLNSSLLDRLYELRQSIVKNKEENIELTKVDSDGNIIK